MTFKRLWKLPSCFENAVIIVISYDKHFWFPSRFKNQGQKQQMCPTKLKNAACIQSIDNLKSDRKLWYRFKYKIKSGIKCLYNILRHFILGTAILCVWTCHCKKAYPWDVPTLKLWPTAFLYFVYIKESIVLILWFDIVRQSIIIKYILHILWYFQIWGVIWDVLFNITAQNKMFPVLLHRSWPECWWS